MFCLWEKNEYATNTYFSLLLLIYQAALCMTATGIIFKCFQFSLPVSTFVPTDLSAVLVLKSYPIFDVCTLARNTCCFPPESQTSNPLPRFSSVSKGWAPRVRHRAMEEKIFCVYFIFVFSWNCFPCSTCLHFSFSSLCSSLFRFCYFSLTKVSSSNFFEGHPTHHTKVHSWLFPSCVGRFSPVYWCRMMQWKFNYRWIG